MSSNLDLIYKLNRNIWVTGEYAHITQEQIENNVEIENFDSNAYNISVKLQL